MQDFIDIIVNSKFDAVSLEWEEGVDLIATSEYARSRGLYIQSLHAPFGKSADMWSDDIAKSRSAIDQLMRALDDCACLQIPILVLHTWIGFEYSQVPGDTGLLNYRIIADRARELGVKIAFENTEGEEFLCALMDHFKGDDTVGFCWDSGHEMCYNHSEDLLKRYGEKLLITHLNDNLGISRFDGKTFWTDDLHLLPFDGIADWKYNADRLKKCPHLEYLNFELGIRSKPHRHENDIYADMKLEVYFAQAYNRACRIANMYLSD